MGITFVHLFCMDFNVELSLAMFYHQHLYTSGLASFCYSDVNTCFDDRSRVYSNTGSQKQWVWGAQPPEALGCLVSELPKIQDFECISQFINTMYMIYSEPQ